MLITPEYAAEQKRLHATDAAYGARGFYWAYLVAGIAVCEGGKSVLDYGCGKGSLAKSLRDAKCFDVREYDPGIPGKDAEPKQADIVSCVDVLEHIEPECVQSVCSHLASLCKVALFVAISTKLAKRWLSDGRNTHLTVRDDQWWREQLEAAGFTVRRVWQTGLKEWVALLAAPGWVKQK